MPRLRLPPKWFLLAMSLLAAGCGGSAVSPDVSPTTTAAVDRSWEQQIQAIREATGTEIHASSPVAAEQWSQLEHGCEQVTVLDVEQLDAPETALSLLARLPQLRQLRIGSPVGDQGLRQIARVGSLRVLNLPQGRFTNAGLHELAPLPHLELLRFHSPHVTDDGMQHIALLPALRFLHLIDVPITDAGLSALHGLDRLESFYLDGGDCTDEGLSRLLHQLPELHFHHNQLHLPGDPQRHPH